VARMYRGKQREETRRRTQKEETDRWTLLPPPSHYPGGDDNKGPSERSLPAPAFVQTPSLVLVVAGMLLTDVDPAEGRLALGLLAVVARQDAGRVLRVALDRTEEGRHHEVVGGLRKLRAKHRAQGGQAGQKDRRVREERKRTYGDLLLERELLARLGVDPARDVCC